MRWMLRLVLATAALCAATAPAAAQIALESGLSFPMGDVADVTGTGYHVRAVSGFVPSSLPFGLRFGIGFERLPGTGEGEGEEALDLQQLGAFLHAVIAIGNQTVSPYFLLGGGAFGTRFETDLFGGAEWEAGGGLSGGAGVLFDFASRDFFLEARFQHVFQTDFAPLGSIQTIPVTIGIVF